MVEIVVAVASKVAEYLVAPIASPFRYLWNYKSNLENLNNEVKKLEARRETVRHSVEDAKRNNEEIEKHVENWLGSVENIISEASEVVEDNHQQANMQCLKGLSCTNLMKRYQHSKKAAKLKAVVGVQEEAGKFEKVSYRTIPEQACLQPSKGHQDFESRKIILKNVIDALSNSDVNMVGIYGMGGVGKTTLAKEVAREALQKNSLSLFDKIIFVEVSESLDVQNIQGEIADNLGLQFTEETISGRANKLCDRLKKEKKILLILDNIWGKIDFEKIGIPFENDSKGLKLLLTTRNLDVLRNEMDSQHNFHIEALNEADAWSLFKSIVGTCTEQPDLKSIALEVAKECGGMPVAIVIIARALKNKGEYEWKKALGELKNPSLKSFGGIAKEVYTSIKLSYDYLENEELKEIFLLCSRMGNTYNASIQDLFRYALGLGLFESYKMEDALCNVYASVNKLKATSLLLNAPNESKQSAYYDIPDDSERFAIHDVVCDIARSIASGKENVCTMIDDVTLHSLAKKNKLENCTSITLYNVDELPKDLLLVCPKLKFFYMKTKYSFSRIHDDFFTEMSGLQVLHLIEMNLSPLPTSFSHLVNLQTLCLDECKLGDIAVIGKLEKLEILSFHGSEILELPEEMRQLTSIRLLDLTNFSALKNIPPSVVSCFTRLEALYMYNASIKWEVGGLNIGRRNVGLNELKHLCDGLTTLEICIPEAKMSEGLLFSQLERYKISIGFYYNWKYPPKSSRTLRFKIKRNDNADGVISQLKGIKELELFGKRRYGSMHSVSCDALFSLESLVLKDLNLEKICNGPLLTYSFCQLRTIRVNECNKLTNIFSFSTNRVLPQLQEIQVSSCENMEEIFAIEREDDVNSTEVTHDQIQFSQLHSVSLNDLPLLKSFCHGVKTASPLQLTSNIEDKVDIPKSLFNDEKVVFPNLQNLVISGITDVEKIWHNLPLIMSSCVQNLTKLNVSSCHNLKELFSSSAVITVGSREEEDRRDTISFPKLNYLEMRDLTKLTRLWSGYYLEFPSLKEFIIYNCPRLKAFIFDDKVVFPNLQTLKIYRINHVEKIWENIPPTMSFCVQNLTELILNGCDNLKKLFSSSTGVTEESRKEDRKDSISFPKLNRLQIENLAKLTRLWSGYYMEFPLLKEFKIGSCPSLKTFIFNDKVRVPSLEKMQIFQVDNLKMIWHNQLDGDSFRKLKSLEVGRCRKLLKAFPSKICGRLLSLESLIVRRCGSLEEIFDLQGIISEKRKSVAATQSRDLCFSNLQELVVSECRSMKYLFAASNVANDDYSPKFLFPKLTSLKLCKLPKLRSFYPGRHSVEGPVLKRLELWNVQIQMQQPLCLVEEAFPCLEELKLGGKNIMMMWQDQVPESLFDKIKILGVQDDDSTSLPLCILQRFQNLKNLSIFRSSYKEIFSNGEDQIQSTTPTKIKTLYLYQLEDLNCMWKQDFKLDLIFQNLELLDIQDCNRLINVMPHSASFKNLTIIEVTSCHSLINIGTSSTAKSLVQLTEMTIVDCKKITEVVGNHGDVTEDEIIFPKLKTLSLLYLRSLTSFCSWNVTLQFPSLEYLIVDCCPKMKIFSRGVLTTQMLWQVEIDNESIELNPDVDIDKAIQEFHEKVNAKNMQRLQKDNELKKAKQQLEEEENVQSSIKDCEGSSSHRLEIRGDSV